MAFQQANPNGIRPTPLTIDRARLLEKLQLTTQHKLTLVIAPPGYGKTTLVAQFAQSTPIPVAWHLVEERERDVPNLVEHGLASLSEIVPSILDIKPGVGATPIESAASITDY